MDWINVKSSTPEPYVRVLCRIPREKPLPTVREGYISKRGIWVVGSFDQSEGEVTHWAEMPAFPGDDEEAIKMIEVCSR